MTVKSRRQALEPLVLLLDANPYGTDPLQLARECADIQDEVAYRGVRIEARRAVSVDDAMRHMTDVDPAIVQFSGHGGNGAAIILEDDRSAPQPVSAAALAMMIEAAGRRVRVAVINSCFGLAEADALTGVVDCVVGCDGPISDEAARAFAVRFYGALAAGRSVENAVAQGRVTLVARNLAHGALPRCVTRTGVDADAIVLRRMRGRSPWPAPRPRVRDSR